LTSRLKLLSDPNGTYSLAYRVKGFNQGIEWWRESPVVGKGAGFREMWNVPLKIQQQEYSGLTELRYGTLHNFYPSFLAFGGLIGAFAFLIPVAFIFAGLIRLLRKPSHRGHSFAITIVATTITSLAVVFPSVFTTWNFLIVWMALGLGYSVVTIGNVAEDDSPIVL
ncbi:hypothetical protein JYU04_04470, partial [Dehalococcoides mccartyi]|nr:hypothetical protein [Dehalococcoides mccartyi]